MKNRKLIGWIITSFLTLFFCFIAFFLILHIIQIPNSFKAIAIVFESLGFGSLIVLFIIKASNSEIEIGFFVTVAMIDIVHIIAVTSLNCFASSFKSKPVFTIIHFGLLFLNMIICMPMLFFGIKEECKNE